MTSLYNNPHFFSVTRWEGLQRILRCGACGAETRDREAWAVHWSAEHGTEQEARAHLAMRAKTSARAQRWAKANREKANRNKKLSALPGSRVARALAQWWRENWPECSRCGQPVQVVEIAGSTVSFCRRHGFSWRWKREALFWTAAPAALRTWESRRRNGTATSGALKAWVTRRKGGHVTEDCRRAWRTKRARYGPSGLSRAGARAIATANSRHMRRNWMDPSYSQRQKSAIAKGWVRRRTGGV